MMEKRRADGQLTVLDLNRAAPTRHLHPHPLISHLVWFHISAAAADGFYAFEFDTGGRGDVQLTAAAGVSPVSLRLSFRLGGYLFKFRASWLSTAILRIVRTLAISHLGYL